MKIFIASKGDRSVGIGPDLIQMTWNLPWEGMPTNERELKREELRRLFQEFLDNGEVSVLFEDECQECGRKIEKYKAGKRKGQWKPCGNKGCPSSSVEQ